MNKRRKNRELIRSLSRVPAPSAESLATSSANELRERWSKPSKSKIEERKRNVYCEICNEPVGLEMVVKACNYCPVVVHESCMKGKYVCKLPKADWICPFCVEAFEYDKLAFKKRNEKLNTKKKKDEAQITISKTWRKYKARKAYLSTMNLLRKLQRAVRLRFATRLFKIQRMEKLRPLGITIKAAQIFYFDRDKLSTKLCAHDVNNKDKISGEVYKDLYMIISVSRVTLDRGREVFQQNWRIAVNCSHSEASKENSNLTSLRFDSYTVIGGVSGLDTLIFTLCQSSGKGSDKDIFIGQASVDMESHSLWYKGGQLNLKLNDMEFLVMDPGLGSVSEFLYPSRVKKKSKETTSSTGTGIVWGSISVGIDVFYGMNADCGWIFASAPDEISRSIKKIPNCYNLSSPVSIPRYDLDEISLEIANLRQKSFNMKQVFPTFTMKKAWVCIANNFIYLYLKFGDNPKVVLNLKGLNLKVCHISGQKSYTFTFEASGYPEVSLSNFFPEEELRWKVLFLASKIIADDTTCADTFDHEKLCGSLKRYRKIEVSKVIVRKSIAELMNAGDSSKGGLKKAKNKGTVLNSKFNLKKVNTDTSSSSSSSSSTATTTTTTSTTTSVSVSETKTDDTILATMPLSKSDKDLLSNLESYQYDQLSFEELAKERSVDSEKAAGNVTSLLSVMKAYKR